MRGLFRSLGAIVSLWLALGGVAHGAPASGLPSPESLFGCPLDGDRAAFVPPAPWITHRVPELGLEVQTPPGWRLELRGPIAVAKSPDGLTEVELRSQRLGGKAGLSLVRDMVELRETGPSHVGRRCSEGLSAHLTSGRPWIHAEVAIYGRPLGERRRTYGLYAARPSDVLAVFVSTRWGRGEVGPDLKLVRHLLGSVRPSAPRGDVALLAP